MLLWLPHMCVFISMYTCIQTHTFTCTHTHTHTPGVANYGDIGGEGICHSGPGWRLLSAENQESENNWHLVKSFLSSHLQTAILWESQPKSLLYSKGTHPARPHPHPHPSGFQFFLHPEHPSLVTCPSFLLHSLSGLSSPLVPVPCPFQKLHSSAAVCKTDLCTLTQIRLPHRASITTVRC